MRVHILSLLVPAVAAALVAWLLTPLAEKLSLRLGAIDHPGDRKIHTTPIPRLGGLAVLAATFSILGILYLLPFTSPSSIGLDLVGGFVLGLLPIAVVSFIDDLRPLSAWPKFAAQFAGAGIAVAAGFRLNEVVHAFGAEIHLGWLAIPLSLFWIVGLTNAFNIVDGLDGLSAGLALISAISLAGVCVIVDRPGAAVAAIVLAGALLGFLPRNVYPARVFLGDTGATAIGFFLATVALRGGSTLSSGLAVLVPIVVLGIPITDTLVSMARRLMKRLEVKQTNGVFEADRNHIHHRLMSMGLNQRRAVLTLYGVGAVLALCGFASVFLSNRAAGILLGTLMVASFIGLRRLDYEEFAIVRRGMVLRIYDTPMLKHGLFAVFVDLALVAAAFYAAIVLKWDDWTLRAHWDLVEGAVPLFAAVTLAVFWGGKMYRGAWRVASVEDVLRASRSAVVASAAAYGLFALLHGGELPPTFILLYTVILTALVNAVRVSYRFLAHISTRSMAEGEPVVIYGAGAGGRMALREMLGNHDVAMRPVGFIDDDAALRGHIVNGYPVLGTVDDLEEVLAGRAKVVVVASEKVPHEKVVQVKEICAAAGAKLRYFRMQFHDVAEYELDLWEKVSGTPRLRVARGKEDAAKLRRGMMHVVEEK